MKTDKRQLTLNFDRGLSDAFESCREVVMVRLYQQTKKHKEIAADMDLSPSHLSRKLSQSPNDTMRLTLDDLEKYLQSTPDRDPIYYLIEKYLTDDDTEIEVLRAKLAKLERGRKP